MKYKEITLLEGPDSEAEILCSVTFDNPEEENEIVTEMEEQLFDLLEEQESLSIEAVSDTCIKIRSSEITFDHTGVELIKEIYGILVDANMDAQTKVAVHVDGNIWFQREDGTEYNEDECSLEEFLENIEY